jgi:uncharacterized phage protein (TIGR02218 family)
MLTIPPNLQSLLDQKLHRYTVCWKITRKDGLVYRFTDHNTDLTFDNELYRAVGGFKASARQKQMNLKTANMDIVGVLDSSAITTEDLRTGRFREAEIREFIIDWMYPWSGAFVTAVYWIDELTFDGLVWEARIQGMAKWLRQQRGRVFTRNCRHELGDAICQVNVASFQQSGTVLSVDANSPRSLFYHDVLETNNYFSNGFITWTSGPNNNLGWEIKAYDATGRMRLHMDTFYDIAIGHTFTIIPGCAKTPGNCRGVDGPDDKPWANNIVRFGGYHLMPGNDKMMQTPNAHT